MELKQAAQRSGLSTERVRHYTATGLLGRGRERKPDGYDERDVAMLSFVRQGRALGFSVGELRTLLELWHDTERPAEVLARLAEEHAERIEQRIGVLQAMLGALRGFAEGCRSGRREDCPIPDLKSLNSI